MEMKIYNKLVRDKIPDIIRENGGECVVKILSTEDYIRELEKKLDEEVSEYHESKSIEELADIMQVCYSIANAKGYDGNFLNDFRIHKRKQRGGFEGRIFLEKAIENKE